jgi:uncharacterized protein YceH (UPF0502 family)
MNATEAEVQTAVDELKYLSLVAEGPGSRVTRYEHNVARVLQVPSQSVAILAVLMLRGPQTPGELRINCERLHKFSDISSVEVFLQELRDRASGALVTELPRNPGARENRWAHLLSGAPAEASLAQPQAAAGGEAASLSARVQALEQEVAQLKAALAKLGAGQG